MPIKNDPSVVRQQLQQALQNGILSSNESKKILKSIEQDGVTQGEVDTVVEALKQALGDGINGVKLDTSTSSRRSTLNRLLGQLDSQQPLAVQGRESARAGSVSWLDLMVQQNSFSGAIEPLSEKTYSRGVVGVEDDGSLALDNTLLKMNSQPASAELNEALWGLTKSGQMQSVPADRLEALQEKLVGTMKTQLSVEQDAPGKFSRFTAATAAAGALADTAESWNEKTIDSVLEQAKTAPTPLMQALLLRGLDKAHLSDAQKATLAGIEKPEHGDELIKTYDQLRMETMRIDYKQVDGEAAEFGLKALTFAKDGAAIENITNGMKTWKNLNNDYSKPWDSEELGHMNRILEGYVEKYPQASFVYGTFANEAPKEIANVTSARVQEELTGGLEQNPAKFGKYPLSAEQADFVKTLLPNIQDKAAAERLEKSLAQAGALFSSQLPSSWGTPTPPSGPMPKAAFEMFKEAVAPYQEQAGGTETGKLDYNDFQKNFTEQVKDLHSQLKPHMAELNGNPPRWGETQLSAESAQYVKGLLQDNLRSSMTVDNIGRALEVVSKHHGGPIQGESLAQFRSIVEDYKSEWPDRQTFDFNKLERIASYKVEGKEVPLCTVNGKPIGLAEFYNKVGLDVRGAVTKDSLRHDWQADRIGVRAREAVEILDVVAEQSLRGEGPVAELRNQFPNAKIDIMATGQDGAHQQFIYQVQDGSRTRYFAQGSDGSIQSYNGRRDPVMFSANIGKEGELNIKTPDKIDGRRYVLQSNYGVGDKIDMEWYDPQGSTVAEEGKPFQSNHRVVEAEILSFDANGNYTVRYTPPNGTDSTTKTLSLADIRRANNPHYFKPISSYYSDVTINVNTDPALKEFLQDAQPIIDRYLPQDGSLVGLSAEQLAKRQKDCISALMDYTTHIVKYPSEGSSADANSQGYHKLLEDNYRVPLGELVKLGRGVCRHQCILEHLLLQQAGIDSRLASGAANTSSGNFRGYHIWTEVSLADGSRFLSDQTWDDPTVPLWDGAYNVDKRRTEMYNRTARYDSNMMMD
ncbi:MAG: hypothetical protein H6728_15135 [Myxococcales bacterium]|nr:hypothetical protein [Myxococcales bacterium]